MNAQKKQGSNIRTKTVELPQDLGGRFQELVEQWTTPEDMASKFHKLAQRYLWYVMNGEEAIDSDCRDAIFLMSEMIGFLTPGQINPLNP